MTSTVVQYLDGLLTYGSLVTLVTSSIYAGALGSYPAPNTPTGEDKISYEEDLVVGLLLELAGMICLQVEFPFKYLGGLEDWTRALKCCFFVMGIGCVWSGLTSLTKSLIGPARYKSMPRFLLELTPNSKPLLKFRFTTLLLFPLAAGVSITFFFSDSKLAYMLTTNILFLSFVHAVMSHAKILSTYKGCSVLGVLFCLEFWRVYTSALVDVDTPPAIPIKLLWPRSIFTALSILPPSQPDTNPTMLLSLGDVFFPGEFIALSYRLDKHRCLRQTNKMSTGETMTYFRGTMIGYTVGLSVALGMHILGTTWPALLYLSPSCWLSFYLTAAMRAEWAYVWAWEEPSGRINERDKFLNWLGYDVKQGY